MATTGNECSNCLKYRDGWCRFRGVNNPAAIRPDRRSRLCRPVSRKGIYGIDYGSVRPADEMTPVIQFGRKSNG